MSVKCKERTSQAHGHHPISKLSRPFLHAKGRDSQGRMETNAPRTAGQRKLSKCDHAGTVRNESGMPMPTISVTSGGSSS